MEKLGSGHLQGGVSKVSDWAGHQDAGGVLKLTFLELSDSYMGTWV